MPTARIISLERDYHRLDGLRKRFAAAIRATTSNTLHEDINGVEAFWLHPIDPDDADNVLPYSVDVEFSTSVSDDVLEQLAKAILWTFTDEPLLSAHIPYGTQIGVWVKTPGQFKWEETTKKSGYSVGTRSEFSFFGGEKLLVLVAPDDPDAPFDNRHRETYWSIWVEDAEGEQHATRGARGDSTPDELWSIASSALYQAVSSNEVDQRTAEIKNWLEAVFGAHLTRNAT
jgi:hypothetical protein